MLTYLHHSDPSIAHYRKPQWNFVRGAVSTVDRPLLGWAGRFFLHNVSHDHVGPLRRVPNKVDYMLSTGFPSLVLIYSLLYVNRLILVSVVLTRSALDNQPQVTEVLKTVLKDDYNYDTTVCEALLHLVRP